MNCYNKSLCDIVWCNGIDFWFLVIIVCRDLIEWKWYDFEVRV